ncbi:transcription regulator with HTH domain protein [Nostoc piscinale CENA21]|uniref:Transcription regulator with HTH domain protein n=1 Tax=Nostoc piscinale CENA21 TaxID=224013 RepID=A0A0M4SKA2_9NOSO|nr:transcriptional regulator [Nostoc piscinale]ALF53160.1 transcription regulator with HTH domain protein [Nostoc piscinale CENA21]
MTHTINSTIYGELLLHYQPRIIKTESENEQFLAVVEELLARPDLSPEEDILLELLVKLIEDFEAKHYQLNASTPGSRLLHLMDARNLQPSDLVEVLGSSEIVNRLLDGEQEITKEQAKVLGQFFHVEPELFCS